MRKQLFTLFLLLASAFSTSANAGLIYSMEIPEIGYGSGEFYDCTFVPVSRENFPSLTTGRTYRIVLYYSFSNPDDHTEEYSAVYTCNLDDPESIELDGKNTGTLATSDGYIGFYNIAESTPFNPDDLGGGDYTEEFYSYMEMTEDLYLLINCSNIGSLYSIEIYDD